MKKWILLFLLVCVSLKAEMIRYVHVPKCGGSTIKLLMRAQFPKSEIYPYGVVGDHRIMATRIEEAEADFAELPDIHETYAGGHFPMWFFKKKDPDFETAFYFTSLRDPVERVLSHSRYNKREGRSNSHPFQIPPNMMCKMFSDDPTLEGEALLQNAIENLTRMDFVIFMDNYNRDVRQLFRCLNLQQPKTIFHANTTRKEPVSDEVIQEVRRLNALDIRLYKWAKAHFSR